MDAFRGSNHQNLMQLRETDSIEAPSTSTGITRTRTFECGRNSQTHEIFRIVESASTFLIREGELKLPIYGDQQLLDIHENLLSGKTGSNPVIKTFCRR
jgi:hypothetical protein